MPDGRERVICLLTGFGPFPGVPENASAMLVGDVAALFAGLTEKVTVHSAVLETSWQKAPARLEALFAEIRPDLAIHFGVSGRLCDGFAIETAARWACSRQPDVDGASASLQAQASVGPILRTTCLDTAALMAAVRDTATPCRLSHNAGAYLCNAIYYASLARMGQGCRPRGGRGWCGGARSGRSGSASVFVHIPANLTPSAASTRYRASTRAAARLVAAAAAQVRQAHNRALSAQH